MKTLDPTFKAAITSEVSTIAWCWQIQRKDSQVLGFTSFDMTLIIDGVNYEPFTGFAPSADSNSEGLEKNNSQELGGILTSEQINPQDLLEGKYDGAKVTCFLVNVVNLPDSLSANPPRFLLLYERNISKIEQTDLGFKLSLRDDDYALKTDIGKQTSKFCEHDLGDANCKVNLTGYTFTTTVSETVNRYQFKVAGTWEVGQFARGKVNFNNGESAGTLRDIATFGEDNLVTLWQPLTSSLAVGNSLTLTQGCGKTLYDCVVRYDNAVNCDCDPHIPTTDQALNTPIIKVKSVFPQAIVDEVLNQEDPEF